MNQRYNRQEDKNMTTAQLNAEIFRSLSTIAGEEGLMKRAAKYLKKLADQKRQEDETLMGKEEFFAKIDHAVEEAKRGEGIRFADKEDMNAWLNSL